MTLYDDYRNTDYLDDISFIGGTDYILYFPLYNTSGNLVDINASTMIWLLSPYGQPEYPILQKEATTSGSNTFVITLNSTDTLALGGVYLQQPEITDVLGKKFRPAQGVIIIRKAIPVQL